MRCFDCLLVLHSSYAHDPAAAYLFGSSSNAGADAAQPHASGTNAAAPAPVTEYARGEALAVLEQARARYRAQFLQEQADRIAAQQQLQMQQQQQQREEQQQMQQQQLQSQQEQEQPERTEW